MLAQVKTMGKIQQKGTNDPQNPPTHERPLKNGPNVKLKGLEEVHPLIKHANVPKMSEEQVKKGPRTKVPLQTTPNRKEAEN